MSKRLLIYVTSTTQWISVTVTSLSSLLVTVSTEYQGTVNLIIHPDFIGTVPNFDSLSWENYEVSRDAKLFQIPNPVPILSHFEHNVHKNDRWNLQNLFLLVINFLRLVLSLCWSCRLFRVTINCFWLTVGWRNIRWGVRSSNFQNKL